MRRAWVAYLSLVFVGLGLVGCGRFGGEQRAAWRTEAEESCLSHKLVRPSAYMSRIPEIDGPGACGITYPFKVQAFGEGSVALTNRVTLGCPIIPQIDTWIRETVQPAAELYFGATVTDIRAGTYSCRGRNNQPGAKTSEHAFGNAIDVMSFRFSDGRDMSVERGWKGAPAEQEFLREVFLGACRVFTTVLAPGSDVYHYNHLHLDLARHDARGLRRICKPILKFEPRLDPETGAVRRPIAPRPVIRPLPEPGEPLEIEDDADPYAVSRATPPRPTTTAARDVPPARPEPARPEPARPGPARIAVTPTPLAAPTAGVSTYPKTSYAAGPPSTGIPARAPAPQPRAGEPLVLQPQVRSMPAGGGVLSGSGLY